MYVCTVATASTGPSSPGHNTINQPVDRHHTAAVGHEHREQTTLLLAAERDRAPVVDHIHRAKHTELHDGPHGGH